MEKRVFIEKQFPLEERSYRDRNNEERVLPIRAFVLNDGLDMFYAEMVGEQARALPMFNEQKSHVVQAQIVCRTYRDKDDVERFSNEVRIVRMC